MGNGKQPAAETVSFYPSQRAAKTSCKRNAGSNYSKFVILTISHILRNSFLTILIRNGGTVMNDDKVWIDNLTNKIKKSSAAFNISWYVGIVGLDCWEIFKDIPDYLRTSEEFMQMASVSKEFMNFFEEKIHAKEWSYSSSVDGMAKKMIDALEKLEKLTSIPEKVEKAISMAISNCKNIIDDNNYAK